MNPCLLGPDFPKDTLHVSREIADDGAKLFALFYKRKGVIIMTDFEMISIFMMILSLVTTLVMIKKDK